ncbi:MAG: hypothetical protein WD942_10210 [Dehalococcoidia bacterium]
MNIVIQCAAQKSTDAGKMRTADGRQVRFVAHPPDEGDTNRYVYAHPDQISDDGRSWRERVLTYNENPGANPLELIPAHALYRHPAYHSLAQRFGVDRLWILSAGWGLIPGSFLTPDYDVTFASSGDQMLRRRRKDVFHDWAMIDGDTQDPLLFLGGQAYLPHFHRLTAHYKGPRIAAYNSRVEPQIEGVKFVRFETPARTNWHYGCARTLVDGTFDPVNMAAAS